MSLKIRRNLGLFAILPIYLTGYFLLCLDLSLTAIDPSSLARSMVVDMEQETLQFDKLAAGMLIKDDCVPIRVGGSGQLDVQYLACSQEALQINAKSIDIGSITVPTGLAQRFNFWRRVYSLWSRNQYVLHVAEFPEVVLEIHDGSRLGELGDKTREKAMKPWLDQRRRQYQQILYKLAKLKTIDTSQLSLVEGRVFRLFAHIDRKDKFAVAAGSLRIQRGQREYIQKGLETASRYLPHVEESFKKEGLPSELARIAFIESSFNLQAMSKVGASGVYQIMPETGRDYLVVNEEIDERNDPIKASRAAAKLLMLNYRMLGEWPLAITAYNHGVGGIRRAMQAAGSQDIVALIEKYDGPNFGFASKNFYAGFLGLLATLQNANKVFPNIKLAPPLAFDVAMVSDMTVSEVKSKYKISTFTLLDLNPDLTRSFVREDGLFPSRYRLKIPQKVPSQKANIKLVQAKL